MSNPVSAAFAAIRKRPAIALAVGGVGIAAAVSVGRSRSEPPPAVSEAVAGGAAVPIAGYGAGLTGGFPGEAGDLYAAERASSTASIVNAINAASAAQAARDAGRYVPLPAQTGPRTVPTPPRRPPPVPPRPAPRVPARIAPRGPVATGPRYVTHTVVGGDWLSKIAARYGTPGGHARIYADNRATIGSNPNLIKPGQRLRVFATKGF